jgi:hypothetical protein
MNNRFVQDCARRAAERLLAEGDRDDRGRVVATYQHVLRRPPEADEIADAVKLVQSLDPPARDDGELYRWQTLVQGLLSSAEFRYLR